MRTQIKMNGRNVTLDENTQIATLVPDLSFHATALIVRTNNPLMNLKVQPGKLLSWAQSRCALVASQRECPAVPLLPHALTAIYLMFELRDLSIFLKHFLILH